MVNSLCSKLGDLQGCVIVNIISSILSRFFCSRFCMKSRLEWYFFSLVNLHTIEFSSFLKYEYFTEAQIYLHWNVLEGIRYIQ